MTDRLLITGATGFVGSHVLEQALKAGTYCAVGVGSLRRNGTSDRITDVLRAHLDACYTHLTHDLTAPLSSTQKLGLHGVHRIVNVASRCSVDESISDPEGFVRNNVDLQLTVLELARTFRVARFVQLSTDEVFGPRIPETPFDCRPSSPYAASKAAQLMLCQAYATTFKVPTSVLTSVNMFGERQSQLAFIPKIVRTLLRGDRVSVHVRDGKPGGRHYVYVADVARRLLELAASDGAPGLDAHSVPGVSYVDNRDLVFRVAAILGVRPQVVEVEADAVRPGYDPAYGVGVAVDVERLTPFDVALERTVLCLAEEWGRAG